jgi:hypothetical protein
VRQPISGRTVALVIGGAMVVLAVAGTLAWLRARPVGRYERNNSGLYRIKEGGKFGYMDRSGRTVIRPQFDNALDFSEGMAGVKIGTKVGYIDTTGKVVITPQFDDEVSFMYGRAGVKLCCGDYYELHAGDRFGFIDPDGKLISAPEYLWIGEFSGSRSNDYAPVKFTDGYFGFVTRSGKIAFPKTFQSVSKLGFQGGPSPASNGRQWGYIDKSGKWVVEPQFDDAFNFSEGLGGVSVSGKWGYIDARGKFAVNPQFDAAFNFDCGAAPVRTGANWTLIDAKGDPIGGQTFLEIEPACDDGLRPARTKDGWGYVKGASFVVRPIFDTADSFLGGLARVTIGDRDVYVDKTGAYVGDPFRGRAIRPGRAVQEIWEGDTTGPDWKAHERFLLTREGARIKGFYLADGSESDLLGTFLEVSADLNSDDSFHMICDSGAIWNGRFLAPVIIAGTQPEAKPGSTVEFPFRLHFVREAATADLPTPLPPTSSEWNVFFDSFKAAIAHRDQAALTAMLGQTFYFQHAHIRSADDIFRQINWQQMDKAIKGGDVRETKNDFGRPLQFLIDAHPCPTCTFQLKVGFLQEADGQWRWIGITYVDN